MSTCEGLASHDPATGAARAPSPGSGLKADCLGAKDIVFFIIAAASPLTCIIATTAIMIGRGNGIGSPAAFAFVTGILLLFAVGYLAMTPFVRTAGSLYAYVTLGLGRHAGLGCAALMILAYTAVQAGCYGGFGYYAAELVQEATGLALPWWAYCFAATMACLLLSLRGVHSGAVVLGVLLTTECLLLFVLCLGIVLNSPVPLAEFSLQPFSPRALLAPGVGVSLVFACAGFIGFEGSAIYREEARDPDRTIPRATYFAVVFMGTLFSVTTWLVINALGLDKAVAVARRESGNLIFHVSDLVLGHSATYFFNVFIITALFAATLTFHNNIARYLYTLGRQRLLWPALGHTSAIQKAPYVACIAQIASVLVILSLCAVIGLDPYNVVFATLTGWGAVGLIFAQAVASLAILAFFLRNRTGRSPGRILVAPALACLGFVAILLFAFRSADLLLGIDLALAVPVAMTVFLVFAGGMGFALVLRRRAPEAFARIHASLTDGPAAVDAD
ncbi:APC family permease [Novosphingobium bradum]|uniref:APC family permease n=1 Tax=Novosphingobium bradum TaxID=1737444 RepID=A0ABV7IPX0_9SPHN